MQYIVLPQYARMADVVEPDSTDTTTEEGESGQGMGPGERDAWWQEEETE